MHSKQFALAALCAAAGLAAGCSSSSGGGAPALQGPQVGSASVNLATAAVTFPTQPQGIKLSGTAVYDDPTDVVTLSLTLRNASKTILQNPKVIPTNLTEGTVTGDGSFGVPSPADGSAPIFISYGPEAVLPKGTVTRDIVINGVTGAVPDIAFDLEVLLHPFFVYNTGFEGVGVVDSSGALADTAISVESLGFKGLPPAPDGGTSAGDTKFEARATSPDKRYVYFTCWNQPAVGALDLSTLTMTLGSNLTTGAIAFDGTGALGSVADIVPSLDGNFLFCVLNDGTHSFRTDTYGNPLVRVVKLNSKSLAVVDSVDVVDTAPVPVGGPVLNPRGRNLSLSADGTQGAMAIVEAGQVFLLNMTNLTVIDQDAVTAGNQGFDVSATSVDCRVAAISPDGTEIYVAYKNSDGTLDVIDVATGTITPLAPTTLGTSVNISFLKFGPDGRLYYGRNFDATAPTLSIFDPGAATWTETIPATELDDIYFGTNDYCLIDGENSAISCYGYDDDTVIPTEAAGLNGVPITVGFGHGLVRTTL